MTSAAMLRGDGGFASRPGPQPPPRRLPDHPPGRRLDIMTYANSELI
jgi:hypothetical protein